MPVSDEDGVRLCADGPVATLRWSRPERRNAIGRRVCDALSAALESLAARDDVRVVVLSSDAPPFCAGWDVNDFTELAGADRDVLREFFRHGRRMLAALAALPQVTLAAPKGLVLGFGCALAARADLVYAADDAVFGIPEIRLGIPPATVLPELLAVMPDRTVTAWALDGARRPASEAKAAGLVTHVVPADRLDDEVRAAAELLAGYPDDVLRRTKALLRRVIQTPPAERTAVAVDAAIERFATR
ncbi:enoyl-CoA hydratase/isomerase family protein [Dactylosporangium sp. CA-139066]|uniref:enoyl-CoA hydratase/isomerase family protein n=1 Tax=Dactylosporangium sp. CA-139066 TaxID=3239930 RepID=UPI003D92DF4D